MEIYICVIFFTCLFYLFDLILLGSWGFSEIFFNAQELPVVDLDPMHDLQFLFKNNSVRSPCCCLLLIKSTDFIALLK